MSDKKYLWWTLAGIGGAAALGAVLWAARYKIVRRERDVEIRDCTPMIAAEIKVSGDRAEAIQKGFRTLADYIFGNNTMMSVAVAKGIALLPDPVRYHVID